MMQSYTYWIYDPDQVALARRPERSPRHMAGCIIAP